MAGAGYKLFNTGDVLTAAQVNTYLNEQTVMVFASSTARTTALSGVLAEGMMSYLQDTNAVEVYNGSSWVNVGNAGDITEVQAGVGISIASGTGPIPVITNSSTDLITTAGDILYGTAADTMARLGIGTAGQVLKVNSGATAPEWGAAAGGSLTSLATGSLSSTTTSITSISGSYTNLLLVIYEMSANANGGFTLRFNSDSGSNYYSVQTDSVTANRNNNAASSINIQTEGNLGTNTQATNVLNIYNYASSSIRKLYDGAWFGYRNTGTLRAGNLSGAWDSTSAITSIQINAESPNTFDNGSYILYGVN